MRQIILIIIIAILGVMSLIRPRVAGYGYLWYTFMRPEQLAWVSSTNYYSAFLALCALFAAFRLMVPGIDSLFKSKLSLGLIVLVLISGVCTVTAVNQSFALDAFLDFSRGMTALIIIPILFKTPEEVRTAFYVAAFSIGFLGLKFGVYGVLHGGIRLAGGYGQVTDNNFVALLLAMGVPLCWYSAVMAKEKWVRLSFYGMVFFSMLAVVLTFSRGGAIALGMSLVLMALRSRHKILVIALLIASVIPAVILAGSAYTDRLATVADPMAEGSAASRIYLIKIGLHMWRDYPIFGVGFGRTNQQALMPRYYSEVVSSKKYAIKVLHNSYIQILVDCGLLGITIFLLIVYGGIYSMGWWARHTLPEWKPIGLGLQTSLFTFAVGCISVSALPSFAAFPALVTIAASWQVVARQVLSRPASENAPAVMLPQAAPALSH